MSYKMNQHSRTKKKLKENNSIIKQHNIRLIIILIILLYHSDAIFSQQDNINITTHNEVTIFCNPKDGSNSFPAWGVFPVESKSIRQIQMNVTLAYPKDRAIAHWDYLDRINILRKGGTNGKKMDIEIGRMLTPYGSNFKEDWSFTWSVDVTDFSSFLRDSIEIEYIHTGYESLEVGWDLTIDFEIDFGPPIANFISFEKMWIGGFQYGNPENDIEESLIPKEIVKKEGSAFGRLRIQHTGHGMDRPSGCSEFCSRWREIIFDGKLLDHKDMWKDCGNNPLYPQGGTWIFDRAYWCPGELQEPDIYDIPLTKLKHTIDLNMEPFVANDINQPREVISSYFFQYSEPLHESDVRVEEIIAPNKLDNYNRFNPIGFNAIIKIRNLGKDNLRTLKIKYKTVGFEENTYLWNGDLKFNEVEVITLPGDIAANEEINTFFVVLSEPNGKEDEWEMDNKLESQFNKIPVIPSKIVVDFLTNKKPEENSLFIVNNLNDTIYMRSPDILEPATNYIDTLDLDEGKYNLVLTDTTGDGLEFWFQPRTGYGRLRLKDIEGNIIHLFESDCGDGQFYSFQCDDDAKIDTSVEQLSVNIFPRMVRDSLTIYTTTNKKSNLKVSITKDGKFIEEHEYPNIKDSKTEMSLGHLEEGRYVMEIYINEKHKMNRRFNKRDSKRSR